MAPSLGSGPGVNRVRGDGVLMELKEVDLWSLESCCAHLHASHSAFPLQQPGKQPSRLLNQDRGSGAGKQSHTHTRMHTKSFRLFFIGYVPQASGFVFLGQPSLIRHSFALKPVPLSAVGVLLFILTLERCLDVGAMDISLHCAIFCAEVQKLGRVCVCVCSSCSSCRAGTYEPAEQVWKA